jgi:CrcB protein
MQLRAVVLVAMGGFSGAVSRHAIALALPETFPWGTLAVNTVGAFLLGLVVYETLTRGRVAEAVRTLVATGFLSSFTTYSTFAAETVALTPTLAGLNILANYAFGGLAVLLAREVIRWRS